MDMAFCSSSDISFGWSRPTYETAISVGNPTDLHSYYLRNVQLVSIDDEQNGKAKKETSFSHSMVIIIDGLNKW